jgi:hypothetical protein
MQNMRIEEHHQAMPLFISFSGDIDHNEAQGITDLWGSERDSWRSCEAVQHILDETEKGRV